MKSVTEFPNFTLNQALKTKDALTAEGKSAEEVQAGIAEKYKLEGDKLKYFINALEVAGKNTENLRRVIVISLNEGETAPSKGVQIEELHYVPEFFIAAAPKAAAGGKGGKGGGQRRGGNERGPKGSPWGISPEELAAKNKGGSKTAKPKTT